MFDLKQMEEWHQEGEERRAERARKQASKLPKVERQLAKLRKIAAHILKEMRDKADFGHESWDPDAHIELTVTIRECRNLAAALASKESKDV